MRRVLVAVALTASLVSIPAVRTLADVSISQHLPTAACNQGTENAHESLPDETTIIGTGFSVPGHEAIPGTENVTPCGHGG